MSRRHLLHDPDCAQVRDVAATADEDPVGYKKPTCTCQERQRQRLRFKSLSATSIHAAFEAHTPLGNGNYRHSKLSVDY